LTNHGEGFVCRVLSVPLCIRGGDGRKEEQEETRLIHPRVKLIYAPYFRGERIVLKTETVLNRTAALRGVKKLQRTPEVHKVALIALKYFSALTLTALVYIYMTTHVTLLMVENKKPQQQHVEYILFLGLL